MAVVILAALQGVSGLVQAQEKPTSGVAGVTGVKQEAIEKIKNVEPKATAPVAAAAAQGVNKIDGVDTINGVKADGRTVPPPVRAVPPPPVVAAGGSIRAVQGVAGINTAKIQNLEKALLMKQGGDVTPTGTGAEKGGKGKAAAAALLGAPLDKPQTKLKEDGRAGFQEFEKLLNSGS